MVRFKKKGLFALRDFVKGEVVTEYGGRILSLEDTKGKDSSYFRVIGLDTRNGIIDGKYGFGSSLGRYINSPPKGNYPNCTWGKYNEKTKTFAIKTNKMVKRGEEFVIRYGFSADRRLTL
jgi:SET domain-containing protein